MKLGTVPDVKLTPRPPTDPALVRRIKGLIADLANLDGADVGLSATLSGGNFAPVPGQARFDVLVLTDHRVKPSQTFRDLVALGPDALPHLLDALDDKTPTKITIKNNFGFMGFGDEIPMNPVSPVEAVLRKPRVTPRGGTRAGAAKRQDGGRLESYTVSVGDACFVAIGQIVGRPYSAVRYQPTAIVVINSPTRSEKLRSDVRAVWAGKDPVQTLWRSLLIDSATEGIFNGNSLDGWYGGSDRQCAAALRLLYYFPRDAAPLVAERLGKLDVGRGDLMRQSVANGARAEYYINAVSWSKEPAVRTALAGVFKRAENAVDLLAAMAAVDDAGLIRQRLEELSERLPPDEGSSWDQGYSLLVALGERTPGTAKAVFQRYLLGSNVQRCRTVCGALEKVRVPWDTEVLAPLLEDRRQSEGTYTVNGGSVGPQLPIRICDAAAGALSKHHPELKFTLRGQHEDLDQQIAVIREQLNGKK